MLTRIKGDHWKPPEERVYKVNCDAMVNRGSGRTEVGVIICDPNGDVFASCAQNIVANLNTKTAKLTAVLKSVQFSIECGLAPCVFEIDNALVVKWINDGQVHLSETGVLMDDINSLASNMSNVKFLHILTNGVACRLALHGLGIAEDVFWMEDYPSCISNLVMADKPG